MRLVAMRREADARLADQTTSTSCRLAFSMNMVRCDKDFRYIEI